MIFRFLLIKFCLMQKEMLIDHNCLKGSKTVPMPISMILNMGNMKYMKFAENQKSINLKELRMFYFILLYLF